MRATVIEGTNNIFTVECENGEILSCGIKGKTLKTDGRFYNALAPGDEVEVKADPLSRGKGQIVSLAPRGLSFARWNVKKRCPQILAANIDGVLLVTTPREPPFRPRFMDRALAQCENDSIRAVIVCNKIDLGMDANFSARVSEWKAAGYETAPVSAKTGEGIEALARIIEGKKFALVGQSGVGKSSVINALDSRANRAEGALCLKYDRGAHTTSKGALLRLSLVGGREARVVDTPGVRRFVLRGIAAEDLALRFREFKPFVGSCAFGMSCSHTSEKGCAIIRAVSDGKISAARYESFLRIRDEIKTGSWED